MRFLFKLILWLIIIMPLVLVGAFYLAVGKTPLVETHVKLTPAQVDRAKSILDQHDPRDLQDGEVNTITIGKRDLDLAVNYFVYLIGRGGSVVELRDGSVTAQATVQLPKNPIGRYLNVDVGLYETSGIPKLDHLQIGRLFVPGWLADEVFKLAINAFYDETGKRLESDLIRRVAMTSRNMSITYQWDSDITDVVRKSLVSAEDQDRLKLYNQHLVDVMSGGSGPINMTDLLRSLFHLAEEQSRNSDAATENRTAIIVLTAYVGGHGLQRLAPQADTWPKAPKREVRLRGRRDFAQHFMISASLSMTGGNIFSDAVGLLKEIDDSRGGSGFSFNDLCADKAGIRSLKPKCTTGKERRVSRWEHEVILEAMQDRLDRHPEKMRARRDTVEHPFGTLKRWMGSDHFLTRTFEHVSTEMSLHVLAYNLKRVMNIMGVEALIGAIRAFFVAVICIIKRRYPVFGGHLGFIY